MEQSLFVINLILLVHIIVISNNVYLRCTRKAGGSFT